MKKKNMQIAKIAVFVTSLFIIFLSVTYAFINLTIVGDKRQVITVGVLDLELEEDENNLFITDALPMYDEVGMIQEAFTFRLINQTSQNTNYVLKLEEVVVGSSLAREDVKYGLTKDGEVKIDLLSNVEDGIFDSGIIGGNQTIEYSLRLWVREDITNIEQVKNKSLRFKIAGSVTQMIQEPPRVVADEFFVEENLGEMCGLYDDGVDTFLVGQCSNNYVWYSGKLWRIVLKNNETGAVKMITDNGMTAIAFSGRVSGDTTIFDNSYMQSWLQQEFLPTLHDYEEYLVMDSEWDATKVKKTDIITRPVGETKVVSSVGLLNLYEYYTTYAHSEDRATPSTGYLNNKTLWWLITPIDKTYIWNVNITGEFNTGIIPKYFESVRPVINLKSTIQISSGNGTISDPYRLVGDEREVVNGNTLIATRYSGEYIIFNHTLYRIVRVEDGFTKIVSVDVPEGLVNLDYWGYGVSSGTIIGFNSGVIKSTLESYYQNLDEVTKMMIQSNTIWYPGAYGYGATYDYNRLVCTYSANKKSTIDCDKVTDSIVTNIALPRLGELFATQITRGEKTDCLLLNPAGKSSVGYIAYSGGISSSTNKKANVRPSMYLKSNVVIASTNTGDGTYEHPELKHF